MKESPFIGRVEELKQLENLTKKNSSSLVVISGRRRIGKSRLVQEFSKNYRFLQFSGLPPVPHASAQDQRNEFARQLSKNTQYPLVQLTDWGDLFTILARETKSGRVVILLDEISWMGSKDPQFLGKLKNVWDMELKSNPELMLILCGSVSSWIEENILKSTGFMGRISLALQVREFHLFECNQLFNAMNFCGSKYDRFKILSIMGAVPRYLEEVHPRMPVEANIEQLCFTPSGILFREFNDIFSDLFSKRSNIYKKIVNSLVSGSKEISEIAEEVDLSMGGNLSSYLQDLLQLGFIRRDFPWKFSGGKESNLSHFRLSDNYLRFYLKYIEPNYLKIMNKTSSQNFFTDISDSVMGLQFENLVLANRSLIWDRLPLDPSHIVNDNPFFQRRTTRTKGCQIDYLIQSRFSLFVCEVKFSQHPIGVGVIEEIKEKITRLSKPRNFSCYPVLIHVNGVTDAVKNSNFFSEIIDFTSFF